MTDSDSRPAKLFDAPKFPKEAALRQNTFRKYHDLLLSKQTRGAAQHGYAALLAMLSLAVDHSHRGDWMGSIPGRIYTVSMGDTSTYKSQQSDPVARLWQMLSSAGEHFGAICGYTTDAGLFKTLCDNAYQPTFAMFDELQEMMQAKDLRGSVLTHYLNTLYAAPAVLQRNLSALNQKKVESKVDHPVFAMHGNIQLRAFWTAVGSSFEQVCNGFLNRPCYFVADDSDNYFLRSSPITEKDLAPLKQRFALISTVASPQARQVVSLSHDAGVLWDRFNDNWDTKMREHYYGAYKDMVARNRDHCARIALCYAADEQDIEVSLSQMESAIAVSEYLEQCVVYILKHHDVPDGPQRISSIEENAIRYLKKLTKKTGKDAKDPKGWVPLKDIRQQFHSSNRPHSEELRKIIESHEMVDIFNHPGSKWRGCRYRYNDSGVLWEPEEPQITEDELLEAAQ